MEVFFSQKRERKVKSNNRFWRSCYNMFTPIIYGTKQRLESYESYKVVIYATIDIQKTAMRNTQIPSKQNKDRIKEK